MLKLEPQGAGHKGQFFSHCAINWPCMWSQREGTIHEREVIFRPQQRERGWNITWKPGWAGESEAKEPEFVRQGMERRDGPTGRPEHRCRSVETCLVGDPCTCLQNKSLYTAWPTESHHTFHDKILPFLFLLHFVLFYLGRKGIARAEGRCQGTGRGVGSRRLMWNRQRINKK